MIIQQFFVKGLAHNSYLLGGSNICAIVDPRRDVDIYLQAARDMKIKITHVLETHLHADFVSGHLELADKTGAVVYAPKSARCAFRHVGVKQGDAFEIEDMRISVLETPGHTPEHVSYVVVDNARGKKPVCVFCGDTLFVGDVGRPDLFPGRAKELAGRLYDSLHRKLLKLPDFCEVYPAHGAGSLCGRAMGAKRTSTIGYEKRYNAALQIKNKDKFIKSLTTNMPAAPDHFARCSAINGKGPVLMRKLRGMTAVDARTFARMAGRKNAVVVDIRSYEAFGGQHVPGSYNIDFGGNFVTFAGWVLPPDKDILIVADSFQQAGEAAVWLNRVGLDRTVACLDGGMYSWAVAGLPIGRVEQLCADVLYAMAKDNGLVVVDVRAPQEYEQLHINGAVNIPVAELRTRYKELDKDKPIALICSTGHRSSLGASLLKQRGFERIYNVAGGMTGYNAAGYAGSCPMCVAPHISGLAGK
jgi:glyoxylase-like metal-dependent hydrolase (beta-lactamase superfamily II)/rhodanese-related sulfurtransferase